MDRRARRRFVLRLKPDYLLANPRSERTNKDVQENRVGKKRAPDKTAELRKESYEFLKKVQETPSPSGYEQPVQRIVRQRMKPFADSIETDVHGNVIVGLNPKGSPRVMLAGHCDQIGLMANYIDDNGFIFFSAIGGIDPMAEKKMNPLSSM